MDFNLTDEQELLVDSIKEFCERYFDEQKVKDMYAAGGVTDELVQAYLESGFGLMGIPEEQGGVPCDRVTLGLLTEEFAHYCGCLTPFLNNTLAMRDLIDFGSPEQVEMAMNAYLETGKPIFSLGFSEPGAGSDNASMTSVTKKQADGTYKLNGVKRFISNAGYDGPCVLFALQKDEESGKDLVTGLVIDKFCEGYSISSPWEKIGYRGSEVYDIFLDDVKVTEDQILGKPGDGFTQLLGTTAYGKLGFTAVFVGTALGAADIALKYCQEKLHRGKSITKFPTTQLRLSTMLTYAHTAELLLLEAADYCDHNHFAGDDIPTMRAVQARTAQAKGYAAETATKVATMAVNAMGAYGVCDEYQAERFLRDAAVAPNIEGSGDIQYLIHGMYVAANGNTN